jgi:DNA-binding transcriptional MerR regulator
MNQWYVKELSDLTGVSVQTLHHYDRIGLLKPSMRLANGYRLYSERDLLKLQQIIALKFFGFDLLQIKNLLDDNVDMIEHFSIQSRFLEEKARALLEASQALKDIIADHSHDKLIHWKNVIELIEVFRMAQQLEKTWAGKIFTPEELKAYANFEHELKQRFTEKQLSDIEKQWSDIINEVKINMHQSPQSEFGVQLGKRSMDWVNNYYGQKYANIRTTIWEKGYKENKIEQGAIPSDVYTWLDQAISAYFRSRIMQVLSMVETQPQHKVNQLWQALLTEMHGDDRSADNHVFEAIFQNELVSQKAKNWVKQYMKEQEA